jgi:hypothetical protein
MQQKLQSGGKAWYRSTIDAAFGKGLSRASDIGTVRGERWLIQWHGQDLHLVSRLMMPYMTPRYWYPRGVGREDESESFVGEDLSNLLVGRAIVTDH